MTLAQSAPAAPSVPVVAAICVAEILSLAGFSIVPALLPQFIEAWSLTNTQAGWLAGIVSAGINAFYTQLCFGLVIVISVVLQTVIERRIRRQSLTGR